MKIQSTSIADVLILEPAIYPDDRGFFMETFHAKAFERAGLPTHFVQDNHSHSHRGVLRGLHYQVRQPQGKLIRAVRGEIFDVAVDLRQRSPTCGKWAAARLSAENRLQLWVPPGCAHGFLALSESVDIIYKVTDFYAPEWERTLRWDDPSLAIAWPLESIGTPRVSARDAAGKPFAEAEKYD